MYCFGPSSAAVHQSSVASKSAIAAIDPVLDSIEPREQQRAECQIRIRRRIGRAELDPFCFRTWRIGWNPNRGGTIACGISEIDRRFESRDESLVTVRGRIGEAG